MIAYTIHHCQLLTSTCKEVQVFLTYWALRNPCRQKRSFGGKEEEKAIEDLPPWVDKVGGLTEVLGVDNIIFI